MSRRFEDWVDVEGLSAAERERLERLHDLLLEVGPPVELPSRLARPERPPARVVPFPRRRALVAALAAAVAVAGAAFGGGYLVGNDNGGMSVVRTAALRSTHGGAASASLRIGTEKGSGNWPVELTVHGLPSRDERGAYYLLLLWHDGKPAGVCGAFRVGEGATTVRFDVPYRITSSTRWVVTEMSPGERYPGTLVLKTTV